MRAAHEEKLSDCWTAGNVLPPVLTCGEELILGILQTLDDINITNQHVAR